MSCPSPALHAGEDAAAFSPSHSALFCALFCSRLRGYFSHFSASNLFRNIAEKHNFKPPKM